MSIVCFSLLPSKVSVSVHVVGSVISLSLFVPVSLLASGYSVIVPVSVRVPVLNLSSVIVSSSQSVSFLAILGHSPSVCLCHSLCYP